MVDARLSTTYDPRVSVNRPFIRFSTGEWYVFGPVVTMITQSPSSYELLFDPGFKTKPEYLQKI